MAIVAAECLEVRKVWLRICPLTLPLTLSFWRAVVFQAEDEVSRLWPVPISSDADILEIGAPRGRGGPGMETQILQPQCVSTHPMF